MFCYCSMSTSSATKADSISYFAEFRAMLTKTKPKTLISAKLPLLSAFVTLDLDMLQQQNIPIQKLQNFGDSGKKELTCYEQYFLLFEGIEKSDITYVCSSWSLTFVQHCSLGRQTTSMIDCVAWKYANISVYTIIRYIRVETNAE